MEQLSLVPNLNLRRLIKDLLNEGGEGLYVHQVDSDGTEGTDDGKHERGHVERRSGDDERNYRFALVAEQILVLKVMPHPRPALPIAWL